MQELTETALPHSTALPATTSKTEAIPSKNLPLLGLLLGGRLLLRGARREVPGDGIRVRHGRSSLTERRGGGATRRGSGKGGGCGGGQEPGHSPQGGAPARGEWERAMAGLRGAGRARAGAGQHTGGGRQR
ncbi:hypothetical protein GUJ93_ZPchr0006g45297 [Zizania palustris]|uniref:Uncharacterized protein n=1 Tax=Zizania palustris TaxID=103762 RepID=A0A8J5VN75_ZIZPA|nr:hypothetical protein GUJ93_ZPchr0006g45297 [Zizania palustris]